MPVPAPRLPLQFGHCGRVITCRGVDLTLCLLCWLQWGELHGVRTAMGAVALAAAAYGTHTLLTRQ